MGDEDILSSSLAVELDRLWIVYIFAFIEE